MDVDDLVGRVRRQWLAAVLALVVLALAAFVTQRVAVGSQEGAAVEINVAGRQRMLSQRIALLAGRVADSGLSPLAGRRQQDLTEAIDLFASSHEDLLEGDPERGLPGSLSGEILALRTGPGGLDENVASFVTRARQVAATTNAAEAADLAGGLAETAADTAEGGLLQQLDQAVAIHEEQAHAAVGRSRTVAALVLALTVACLVLIATRLFMPMEHNVRVAIEHDLRTRRRYEVRLRHQLDHDALTGLWSRERLRREVDAALESPGAGVAVLTADLDDFKDLNDRLGHEVGDALLVRVGALLTEVVRAGAGVARLGGDEFAVLLRDLTQEEAHGAAQRIVRELSSPVEVLSGWFHLSVSVGVAHTAREIDGEDLIARADVGMYAAKRSTRGVAVYTPELGRHRADEAELRTDLQSVLSDHEGLWLAFQPLVDSVDHRIVGMESLLRWQHPRRGLVPPDAFIPMAEASGHMVRLGAWIIDQAIAAQRRMAAVAGDAAPRVWVNVSATQLRAPGLSDAVTRSLGRHGATGADLVVELTESVAAEDLDVVTRELQALRAQGVAIALDDFGTGYSSLSHLRELPLDLLKIDRALVMADDQRAVPVLRAVVALAEELGLAVVAEGIEDGRVQARVTELGIAISQGWYHARPMPIERAVELLAERARGSSEDAAA